MYLPALALSVVKICSMVFPGRDNAHTAELRDFA